MSRLPSSSNRKSMLPPLTPRSPEEAHRASTPLELFFDLVFVVAIAQASSIFHHHLAEGHIGAALSIYVVQFFAIWWAWMNFTWFASAYDNDDRPYRVLVFVQMTGALMLAAGIPGFAMEDGILQLGRQAVLAIGGYCVMRFAMVIQWLRAAKGDPERSVNAYRYAIGITLCQLGWILVLFLPQHLFVPAFIFFGIAELAVPIWAEGSNPTTWHPEHIHERYGLFTIIVLGESILTLSMGIREVLDAEALSSSLVSIICGGLLLLFGMWWFYFDRDMRYMLTSLRRGFIWGYGHYLVFASIAAVGAGLAVAIDQALHHSALSVRAAEYAVIIPACLYLLILFLLHLPELRGNVIQLTLTPVALFLVLLSPLTGQHGILLAGIILATLLVIKSGRWYQRPRA